jgi:transcriptional repressor NrdR
MLCPFCGHLEDKVIDSREAREGNNIRRRRECLACQKRFTTYERIEEIPFMVVKKDGRRERFDRQKVLNGLLKACEKRPVAIHRLAAIVDEVESALLAEADRELASTAIGEIVMNRLRELDKIAYVRFASVYRDFQDEEAFFNEIRRLLKDKQRSSEIL